MRFYYWQNIKTKVYKHNRQWSFRLIFFIVFLQNIYICLDRTLTNKTGMTKQQNFTCSQYYRFSTIMISLYEIFYFISTFNGLKCKNKYPIHLWGIKVKKIYSNKDLNLIFFYKITNFNYNILTSLKFCIILKRKGNKEFNSQIYITLYENGVGLEFFAIEFYFSKRHTVFPDKIIIKTFSWPK